MDQRHSCPSWSSWWLQWFRSYLSDRSFCVNIDDFTPILLHSLGGSTRVHAWSSFILFAYLLTHGTSLQKHGISSYFMQTTVRFTSHLCTLVSVLFSLSLTDSVISRDGFLEFEWEQYVVQTQWLQQTPFSNFFLLAPFEQAMITKAR